MTGHLIRNLVLIFVFAAGIGSILATSPPPPPYHFRDYGVAPAWRCLGADVAVNWKLSKPAPVRVAVGGAEQVVAEAEGTIMPATLLDREAPVAELELTILADDADFPQTISITTLATERELERLAFHERRMAFRMELHGAWDERIRITDFQIEQVRDLACEGDAVSPPAWEVTPPAGAPFLLDADRGYTGRLDPPLGPGRIWLVRPKGGACRLPSSRMEPYLSVRLTAVCAGVGRAP
jgi:hypothetical protein